MREDILNDLFEKYYNDTFGEACEESFKEACRESFKEAYEKAYRESFEKSRKSTIKVLLDSGKMTPEDISKCFNYPLSEVKAVAAEKNS